MQVEWRFQRSIERNGLLLQSGNKPVSKAGPRQQGFLGTKIGQKWHLSWGFALSTAIRTARFGARFQARKRDVQASDLRFYGAPKGIRILIVLVTIGTTWDSLVLKSCDESQ